MRGCGLDLGGAPANGGDRQRVAFDTGLGGTRTKRAIALDVPRLGIGLRLTAATSNAMRAIFGMGGLRL